MSTPQPEMLPQLTVEFLRRQYPFDLLLTAELQQMARAAALDFFPRETLIMAQGDKASDTLYVIQKGSVRMWVRADDGTDHMLDLRGEGEHFGLTSMLRGTTTQMNVQAAEDTLCYLFPKEVVAAVLQDNARFGEALLQASAQRYLERALSALRERGGREGEHHLFALSVKSMLKRELVACPPETSIRRAAEIMHVERISSLIVTDGQGKGIGIITDRDLRSKVVAAGRETALPVSTIMSSPVVAIDQDVLAFEALLRMLNAGIHHLLVTQTGRARGVVTSTDLMLLQSSSPLLVAERIDQQRSVPELARVLRSANDVAALLLQEGVRPTRIARVLAEINDRVTLKLLHLAEAELGEPPLPYCWLVMGSEGRQEQTFKTDQDNGLVYADPAYLSQGHAAESYFERFAAWMGAALEQCGYPPCPGNYMASNPEWRQPLGVWKNYFRVWIDTPEPDQVMHSTIFFDLRGIGPATALADVLRETVLEHARGQSVFLAHLTRAAVKHTTPLGFFRSFILERSGPRKHTFNSKERGTGLIVDLVRVWALKNGVAETNTLERLDTLVERGALTQAQADELTHLYEFLMLLRLRHQLAQVLQQQAPDNALDPDTLDAVERATLKECFRVIEHQQEALAQEMMVTRLA